MREQTSALPPSLGTTVSKPGREVIGVCLAREYMQGLTLSEGLQGVIGNSHVPSLALN